MQLKNQYPIESECSMVLQLDDLKEELAETIDELHNVESLNQTLILRDHMSNNELQEDRKELINVRTFSLHRLNFSICT